MLDSLPQLHLPTSVDVAAWAVCGLTVLAGFDRVLKFKRDHLSENPPVASTYMTKAACEEQHKHSSDRVTALERDMGEIKKELREMAKANEERAGKLHSRIDQILAAVSELKGYVDGKDK